ncbi:hypothetical protein, partial [Bradyrhizobium liaoningense]|uniref:hypothetical protein n=1 Tax=Bradyrhizobium liaoningense TaxID=43992 RepID=UPI00192BC12D
MAAGAWGVAAGTLPAGAVALGPGLPLGVTAPGAVPAGGPPGVPGKVLAWGSLAAAGGWAVVAGATLAGAGAAIPGLTVGWIVALGGIGALPCWISAARCMT